MIRLDDYLSRRAQSRYLEAALARASGETELADTLRAEALELEERVQGMQRRKSEAEEQRIGAGVGRMVRRMVGLQRKGERA